MSKLKKILLTSALGVGVLFGIGPGHSLVSNQFKMHHASPSATQCQSVCLPLPSEKIRSVSELDLNDEKDTATSGYKAAVYSGEYLYSIIFAAMTLAYLRRRPPDFVIEYGSLRI